jgi:cytochrome d ubiquinol oxidase subunit II
VSFGFTPELADVVVAVTLLALNAYVLTGGADFGGGVWDLLAWGPRRDQQRDLVTRSIGPIWEANHVWLIVVVVMTFGAFPSVYSTLAIVLHLPLSAMLVGIVLRGCGFVFRRYGISEQDRRRWAVVFDGASTITPVLLGICVGAVASGAVGRAGEALALAGTVGRGLSFHEVFVAPWLAPFPLTMGVLALASFAFLAAVYLALASPTDELRHDFRWRAYGAAMVVLAAGIGGLLLAPHAAPRLGERLTAGGFGLGLQIAVAFSGLAAVAALQFEWWRTARVAAGAHVSLLLWGWGIAQYPYLIPFSHTIGHSAAPPVTLELLLVCLALGAVMLIPSLGYLFRTFSSSQSRR